MTGTQKAGKKALMTLDRQVKALELRRAGLTYLEISKKMGLVKATVWNLVQDALISTIKEPADAVRALELERLDFITRKLEKRVNDGEDKAINTLLKVMDHRARILGLFAPVTIQGPDGAAVRFVVEIPSQAPTLADWQLQAAAVIDVPALPLEEAHAEQP